MQFDFKTVTEDPIESYDEDWKPQVADRHWRTKTWVPKPFRMKIEPRTNLKKRTKYLWAMLRMAVYSKGYLAELEDNRNQFLDANFGMRNMNLRVDSDEEEEIDEKHNLALKRTQKEKEKEGKQAWYMISDTSVCWRLEQVFIQMLTWASLVITPLTFLFPDLKASLILVEKIIDGGWCFEILLSFFKATKYNKDFS